MPPTIPNQEIASLQKPSCINCYQQQLIWHLQHIPYLSDVGNETKLKDFSTVMGSSCQLVNEFFPGQHTTLNSLISGKQG